MTEAAPPTPEPPRRRRLAPSPFAIFRKRDFRLLWSAQLVSTIGSSLTDLAAGILVFRITGLGPQRRAVLMVTAIPTLFVGLFAGVFVDRFDRTRILLAVGPPPGRDPRPAHPVRSSSFDRPLVLLYVLPFVAATRPHFFDPGHGRASCRRSRSEEELASANSFLSISSFGSTAVGFALSGLLAGIDIHLRVLLDSADVPAVVRALVLAVKVREHRGPGGVDDDRRRSSTT